MADEIIRLEISDRVAIVTLGRDAIDERAAFEMRDAFEKLARDDDVWVIIVTGGGGAFCRGADIAAPQAGVAIENLRSLRVAASVAVIEKPVIAAINGDAIDQGLEIVLACDIRIASDDARLGLTQVERGLMPWDGGTQRLPRLIGRSRAMEMILTSRIVDAREAFEIGLVNQVLDRGELMGRAREIASTVAAHGPIAAGYLKEAVLKGMDMTLEQGLRLEADLNFLLQSTTDRAEGIRSFLERRMPEYRGE
ncbi:MAG: enoyl-CoA hydratase-related protein [Chloroflexi bacterium]|nr:enoyl-CoA hydratase-related protein [Chloroflexota bacterium]